MHCKILGSSSDVEEDLSSLTYGGMLIGKYE
jgi:hypothetical protein